MPEAKEIIHALEGCANEDCDDCYLEDNARTCACSRQLKLDAAKAIKSLQEEIEGLKNLKDWGIVP